MAETTLSVMNRIESEQPITNMVNARMQRITELERIRHERVAANQSGGAGDATVRHLRRDQIIQQTRQQRSTERRGFSLGIQRTPVRSISYENTHAAANASVEQESNIFREILEGTRQNLFGQRISGSTENLSSVSSYGRRPSDTPVLSVPRQGLQAGSESSSGSSTPRMRPQLDLSTGLAEAFAASRASRFGSDNRLASREQRSLSVTRETRETPRSSITSTNGSVLTRSSSLRQHRSREGRYRRRTIQGVDSSISQALELDTTQATNRSVSPVQSYSSTSSMKEERSETRSVTQGRELNHSSSYTSLSSRSSETYGHRRRTVEIYPDDILPVLGLEKEKVVFIDKDGSCRWLNQHHQIVMSCRAKTPLPEIIMKPKVKPPRPNPNDCDGFVAEMVEEKQDERYEKLKHLIKCAKVKDSLIEMNGDCTDSISGLSLFEIYQRGDYLDKNEETVEDIDEKYKTVSLYTAPRDKPDIEAYFASKVVVPLYEGIPNDQLPPELQTEVVVNEPETNTESATSNETHINQYAVARESGFTIDSRNTSGFDRGRQTARQEQVYTGTNVDGSSTVGYSRSDRDQAYSTETTDNGEGNTTHRQYTSDSQSQQSHVLVNNSASSILRQRAEARRQQFMSDRHTTRSGDTIVHSASESSLQQLRSESRSADGLSNSYTRQREERSMVHERSSSSIYQDMTNTNTGPGDNNNVDLVMERLFIMQGGDGPVDMSHLDYEEMRMIQKALEENPSPPPSPEPEVDFEYNESDFLNVPSVDTIHETNSESSNERHLSCISEHSEPRRSESLSSAGALDISIVNDNVIANETDTSIVEANVVNTRHETVEILDSNTSNNSCTSADISPFADNVTSVTSADNVTSANSVVVSPSVTQSRSVVTSIPGLNTYMTARESVLTHTKSLDETVIESRLPRYQRLPAADSVDSRLPLPTMDWSPLEKTNSPLSPKRFSFEEKKSPTSVTVTSGASRSESSNVSKSTISKSSVTQSLLNKPSVSSELTIEIPDDRTTAKPPIVSSDSSKSETVKSIVSPSVKSRGSSRSGSEAPSPAGSETVTTVFEEFVQTIPKDLIEQWRNIED